MAELSITVTSEDMLDVFDAVANNSGTFSKGRALFLEWISRYMDIDVKLRMDELPEGRYRLTPLRPFWVYFSYTSEFTSEPCAGATSEYAETQRLAEAITQDRLQDKYQNFRIVTAEEYEKLRKKS